MLENWVEVCEVVVVLQRKKRKNGEGMRKKWMVGHPKKREAKKN